jgi:hypothetical protein
MKKEKTHNIVLTEKEARRLMLALHDAVHSNLFQSKADSFVKTDGSLETIPNEIDRKLFHDIHLEMASYSKYLIEVLRNQGLRD